MITSGQWGDNEPDCIPRESGDDHMGIPRESGDDQYSPRERG